jgi:hypothetical protein
MQDKDLKDKAFVIPMGGKLVTSDNPMLISSGDFQKLVNTRYCDRYPRGVLGMTLISDVNQGSL